MKIVISENYLFDISVKGVKRYAEIKGIKLYPYYQNILALSPPREADIDQDDDYCINWCTQRLEPLTNEEFFKHMFFPWDIERNDPALVQMVEELGEDANTSYSRLKIIEIPDDVDFKIIHCSDAEIVVDKNRVWS